MNNNNPNHYDLFVGTKTQISDNPCGVCNSFVEDQEELSFDWITCESCGQGYHGNHLLEKGKDGYCLICHGPLLEGVDLGIYKITGITSGMLQFQAKKRTIKVAHNKSLVVIPLIFIIPVLFVMLLISTIRIPVA